MKIKQVSVVIFFAFILELSYFIFPRQTYSANLTVAKDTLQSSRMSFYGRVKTPTSGSHVWIYTVAAGEATSISTAGLKPGDSVIIGGTNSYTIASIVDADEFTITTTLDPGDTNDTDVIYFKAKPQHVITFKTASAINGGFFQVLIPAAASNSNDTIPDTSGFDFASGVTAAGTNIAGEYVFETGVATAAGGTGCTTPANYHCFEFHYTGTGSVGTDITLKIGEVGGANTMIAPAPSTTRVANTADTYPFIVKNFTNGSNPNSATPTDDVTGKIAVIESVRVTATVDPSITFKIEGTSAGSHCGLTTDVPTTATAVPFGILALNTFKSAAQQLTVSTNAVSGYAVTAIENSAMSNLAGTPTYIPDTTCDAGTPCTNTSSGAWATPTGNSGFGYTVAIVSGVTPTIAPTAPAYQNFPSIADTEAPFQIMSNNTTSDTHAIDVCYKIAVGATQAAGNYENQVTYTATASF